MLVFCVVRKNFNRHIDIDFKSRFVYYLLFCFFNKYVLSSTSFLSLQKQKKKVRVIRNRVNPYSRPFLVTSAKFAENVLFLN